MSINISTIRQRVLDNKEPCGSCGCTFLSFDDVMSSDVGVYPFPEANTDEEKLANQEWHQKRRNIEQRSIEELFYWEGFVGAQYCSALLCEKCKLTHLGPWMLFADTYQDPSHYHGPRRKTRKDDDIRLRWEARRVKRLLNAELKETMSGKKQDKRKM